ncbi:MULTISPECIES: TorD/DmsD family molecular chaperone [Halolamina]|uniref:Chaperone TorD involved in molybdoenzyme TorA maturation n=1 Tax=Halolamina pelagica TaxID=699431 RepID=A0A1I5NRI1_9EURY|nr:MULTISPECIES: molecular chaperone TorD family protein [Halolamina]NHX36445.1 molecular chaperone TorD family protein [Halolamina sp. R1-12]SFP24425.1 chaperone TorD involved in molybdoenzyme TorA maturation [Halolamina pelagica]
MDDNAVYDARIELVDFVIEVFHDTPDEAFVERLLAGEIETPGEEVNEHLDAGFAALEEFVDANQGRDVAEVVDELAGEYTALMVGPRPEVLPHETYYREDTEFIGEGLADVEASYGAAGWNPPEEYGEENDHVAVEFAFLRNLIERQRAGQDETVGFERVFLDEHLLTWLEEFTDHLVDQTDEPLFVAGAHVAAGTAAFEDEIVAQLL